MMTTTAETMTLTEFLLARIAEDELTSHEDDWCPAADHRGGTCVCYRSRILAECEAKRRIVELRQSWNEQAERNPEPPIGPILKTQVITADTCLRTLATVYADHPDYRDKWK